MATSGVHTRTIDVGVRPCMYSGIWVADDAGGGTDIGRVRVVI